MSVALLLLFNCCVNFNLVIHVFPDCSASYIVHSPFHGLMTVAPSTLICTAHMHLFIPSAGQHLAQQL
jgi:hypothetical protein